ncbi:putative fad binding domain-containing protein [Seiridium unicorne]|uniref:Fad binding domain-containing protein n=1 Tax=Seiridium unicorne TaxID=138068 RepID=A0ABR2UW01_9PEZI
MNRFAAAALLLLALFPLPVPLFSDYSLFGLLSSRTALFSGQLEALANELTKPDASKETHLMPFFDIQPQVVQLNTLRTHSLAEAVREKAGDRSSPKKPMPDTLKSIKNVLLSFTLRPYPATLLQKWATEGSNVLGLEPELGSLVSILFLTFWENKEDDEKILTTLRAALAANDRDAEARKTLVPFKYLNYGDTVQDPIGSYGSTNIMMEGNMGGNTYIGDHEGWGS